MPYLTPVVYEYQPEWASLPEFSSWLRPDPTSTKHALCCLCEVQLKAGLGQIRRHTRLHHPEFAPTTPWPRAERHHKYKPEWQKWPELSGWLCRSPLDPDSSFCRPCNRQLPSTASFLRKHAATPRHQRRCRRPVSAKLGPSTVPAFQVARSGSGADADTVDVDDPGDGGKKKKPRRAETIEMWQQWPEFAPWLRRSAADWMKAFCLFCYMELTPKRIFLRRHGASKCHVQRAALYKAKSATETAEYRPVLTLRAESASPPPPASSPQPGSDSGGGGGGGGDSGGSARCAVPVSVDNAVYNPAWERRPELAGWITRGPYRPRHAYCRICRMEITPKLAHVRRHGASKRHIRNAQAAAQDLALPDDTQEPVGELELEHSPSKRVFVVETGFNNAGTLADAGDEGTGGAVGDETTAEAVDENWVITDHQHQSNSDAPDDITSQRTEDEADPATAQPQFPRRRLAYQTLWEKVPELRDWLGRSPWDETRPFCRWCRREVTAKLAHLHRHAMSSLHRRAKPARARRKEQDGSRSRMGVVERSEVGPETAASDRDGEPNMSEGSCQPAELGPFGTCLVCKHPLVVRLNIFRSRTKPSRRLVASLLSSIVQQPLTEDSRDPSSSEICTSCASLLDTADELQTKLSVVESEVILKFKSPFPLAVTHDLGDESTRPEERRPDSGQQRPVPADSTEPVTMQSVTEPLQEGDTVLEGEPVAYITIGDADQGASTVVVRTETLENGDLVIYREPVELTQPEPPVDMFSDSLAQTEETPQEPLSEADLHMAESEPRPDPSLVPRGRGGGKKRRPATARPPGEQRTFDCVFCHCSFRTSLALHQHWNTEHPLQLRPCPHCSKRFLYSSSLKQHIKTHEARCFTCEQCGRQFAANCDLKKHVMFVHSKVRQYPCDICGRAFKLKWMLGRHVRLVHEDDEG